MAAVGVSEGVTTTPDGVRIHYLALPPFEYDTQAEFRRSPERYGLRWNVRMPPDGSSPPTRGTVLYLHGWGGDASMVLPWAMALARQGYRGLLPDLRHHGGSDDAPPGFGPKEAQDLLQLLPEWREAGLVEGPLYLFGISYGAATAIFTAAQAGGPDSDAPVAVVAIAPFDNAATAVERFTSRALTARSTPWFMRARYGEADIQRAIDEAGQRLGVELASIDTAAAAGTTDRCLLLIHGELDETVPPGSSARIADAAPNAQLLALPLENHMTVAMRFDWLAQPIGQWFDDVAASGTCPGITLPPDPASQPGAAGEA